MLEIKNLEIRYGDKPPAVKNFNLSAKKGEIVGIVGESGSGKSTVIKSIVGALNKNGKVTRGNILLDGVELIGNPHIKEKLGRDITMIFQDARNTLNSIRKIGAQFVEYIMEHSKDTKKEAHKRAVEMLKKMNLPNPETIMNSYPHELSGGMCQRVGIAMAITFSPELILADEPTSALDVTTQAQIVEELLKLREKYKTTIIIVTHNLGVAGYMSDKIIVMKKGDVLETGTPQEIIDSPTSDYTKLLLDAVPKMEEDYADK